MDTHFMPRILIIDDLFGRTHRDRRNKERANLCGNFLLEDITGDEEDKGNPKKIKKPIAQAVFFRGQSPLCAGIGDMVENDPEGTLKAVADGWNSQPYWSLVLLDLCFYTGRVTKKSNTKDAGMPEGQDEDKDPKKYFGLQLLEKINTHFPDLPVIILSSKPRDEVSREFSLKGAAAFIPRGESNSSDLLKEYLYKYGFLPDEEGEIIGRSKALMRALNAIRRTAFSGDRRNILIRGERGTGKELFAKYIHRQRAKLKSTPFITVNSSTLTNELFPSLLFGIEGKIVPGVNRNVGLIRKADGGELFLDEIRDMLPQVQAGVLRVLQEKEIMPVGAVNPFPVDVSFLSATNIDIEALSKAGMFRLDLLNRLREGGTIFLPPLRERMEDIPLLVEKFVRNAEKKNPMARRRKIEPEALDKLMRYDWPGNIRDLENCIKNAVALYPDVEHLVPNHIELPDKEVSGVKNHIGLPPANDEKQLPITKYRTNRERIDERQPETSILKTGTFVKNRLPILLMQTNRNIVSYILAALENNKDDRNGKLNYPQTWFAMTGEKINSTACQRNIGKYIFKLSDEEIVSIMKQSKFFEQAVIQCGNKVVKTKKRLSKIKELMELEKTLPKKGE